MTALVHIPTQLYLARFVLGAAEAGFFPGVIVYLSHWFIRGTGRRRRATLWRRAPAEDLRQIDAAGCFSPHCHQGIWQKSDFDAVGFAQFCVAIIRYTNILAGEPLLGKAGPTGGSY